MNGKRNPWEGVNLLSFINEERLKGAISGHAPDDTISDDERKRNSFGNDLEYREFFFLFFFHFIFCSSFFFFVFLFLFFIAFLCFFLADHLFLQFFFYHYFDLINLQKIVHRIRCI